MEEGAACTAGALDCCPAADGPAPKCARVAGGGRKCLRPPALPQRIWESVEQDDPPAASLRVRLAEPSNAAASRESRPALSLPCGALGRAAVQRGGECSMPLS